MTITNCIFWIQLEMSCQCENSNEERYSCFFRLQSCLHNLCIDCATHFLLARNATPKPQNGKLGGSREELLRSRWEGPGAEQGQQEVTTIDPLMSKEKKVLNKEKIWCTFTDTCIVPVDNFAALEQRLLRRCLRLALTTYRQLFRWWHRLGTDFHRFHTKCL